MIHKLKRWLYWKWFFHGYRLRRFFSLDRLRNLWYFFRARKLYDAGMYRRVIKSDDHLAVDLMCTYHGARGMVTMGKGTSIQTDHLCVFCLVDMVNQYTANTYQFQSVADPDAASEKVLEEKEKRELTASGKPICPWCRQRETHAVNEICNYCEEHCSNPEVRDMMRQVFRERNKTNSSP